MFWAAGILAGACADDGAAVARDDAERRIVLDAAAPSVDARSARDARRPSSPPDRGATLADAALPDLRPLDVSVVEDLGRIPDAAPQVDAAAILPDTAPPPMPCVPAPHVGDLPSTAQLMSRYEGQNPYGNTHRADSFLSCGDNWFSVNAPMSGDRACITQALLAETPLPNAEFESFEGAEPMLACREDADCASAGDGFTCKGGVCMRGVGLLVNSYSSMRPDEIPSWRHLLDTTTEIERATTSSGTFYLVVRVDGVPAVGDLFYLGWVHFASESYGCPDDWQEYGGDDLPFIGPRGAVCDRWLCPGEFADGFATETEPDGVQAIVLTPRFPDDALELRAGHTVVRVPGADRQCIVLRGVEQTSEGIVTVARPHDLAMDLADYTLIYDQAPDADPATLCASLGAPALAECPPGTLVAEDCWPVVDVDDAQF